MSRRPPTFCIPADRALHTAGFTLIELLVTLSIVFLVALMGVPRLATMRGQLQCSGDARIIAAKLSNWRTEATRLRQSVTVQFVDATSSEPGSVSADLDGDSVVDDVIALSKATEFETDGSAGAPTNLTINGFGLIPAIPPSGLEIRLINRGQDTLLTLYPTGTISFEQS